MAKKKEYETSEPKKASGKNVVTPLKDWHIVFNEYDIHLKEGVEIEVPEMFLAGLKTEKVIK